jgi:hypothetical protein
MNPIFDDTYNGAVLRKDKMQPIVDWYIVLLQFTLLSRCIKRARKLDFIEKLSDNLHLLQITEEQHTEILAIAVAALSPTVKIKQREELCRKAILVLSNILSERSPTFKEKILKYDPDFFKEGAEA